MSKHEYGICKLCGNMKKLTYEHVPPNSAYNSGSVIKIPFEETVKLLTGAGGRMPWDFSGLSGTIDQKGAGDYYLCRDCNCNTGSWYIEEYVIFSNSMSYVLQTCNEEDNCFEITVKDIHPLRIYKAIMTMFCDINEDCFGDKRLREFLLNKESTCSREKNYSIEVYLTKSSFVRQCSYTVIGNAEKGAYACSEIAMYPLGLVLYIDKPDWVECSGMNIDTFANFKYNDVCDVEFPQMPLRDVNTGFPKDYRSKDEIRKPRRKDL